MDRLFCTRRFAKWSGFCNVGPKKGVLTNPRPEKTHYTQIWILFSFSFCLQYLILFTIQIANKLAMKVLRTIWFCLQKTKHKCLKFKVNHWSKKVLMRIVYFLIVPVAGIEAYFKVGWNFSVINTEPSITEMLLPKKLDNSVIHSFDFPITPSAHGLTVWWRLWRGRRVRLRAELRER